MEKTMSQPNLITVTFEVKPDTDREEFIYAVSAVYDGLANDKDVAYVNDHVVKVYETDLK